MPSSHSVSGVGPRCLGVPLCWVGRHSALTAGPLPRQAPPLVLALVSDVICLRFDADFGVRSVDRNLQRAYCLSIWV